ncbi:hypothetical protein BH10PLA2_BH10PLA2_03220 [soil metagenome]
MRFGLTVILSGAFCFSLAAGRATADDGPGIGGKAPAFTLKDQDGKERSLDELLKKGKVALVFYRSASW